MKIDKAWHFDGPHALPPEFRGPGHPLPGEFSVLGPHDLTMDLLEKLSARYAVLIYTCDGEVTIAFDAHRGRFKQR